VAMANKMPRFPVPVQQRQNDVSARRCGLNHSFCLVLSFTSARR
jgi:hypothetical protein